MAKKKPIALIFANRDGLASQLATCLGDRFGERPFCLVCISDNAKPGNPAFYFPGKDFAFSRAIIMFEGLPDRSRNRWTVA